MFCRYDRWQCLYYICDLLTKGVESGELFGLFADNDLGLTAGRAMMTSHKIKINAATYANYLRRSSHLICENAPSVLSFVVAREPGGAAGGHTAGSAVDLAVQLN
jgi:hypothetical protein